MYPRCLSPWRQLAYARTCEPVTDQVPCVANMHTSGSSSADHLCPFGQLRLVMKILGGQNVVPARDVRQDCSAGLWDVVAGGAILGEEDAAVQDLVGDKLKVRRGDILEGGFAAGGAHQQGEGHQS
jgi:hypothetical protein